MLFINLSNLVLLTVILLGCKIISSIVLGLAAAIVVQILTNGSTFSFIFVLISVSLAFIRMTWSYKFKGLIVTNLVFTALFFLFKLYVNMSAV